ncbi:MAG: PLP-dependent transferase [Proteobacteria bacterium]|nr:PLP-dependent transferase [Pseudomonadota bacterium]
MSIEDYFYDVCVHAGKEVDPQSGAVSPPLVMSTTFAQSEPGKYKEFDYSRAGNPTRKAYELALAKLEKARFALAFASGLAAEQAIVQLLEPGSHIAVCDDVYGGTGRLFRMLLAKYDLHFHFIDLTDLNTLNDLPKAKVKLVWMESPTNPLMKIMDIRKLSKWAKDNGAISVVDNTFASSVFQSPLELGADISLHSGTKYLGGHSDLLGGALMTSSEELFQKLKFVQFAAGAVPSPFDCYMYLRSLSTLALRMEKHQANALAVGKFLEKHPKVEKVFHPGLASHPQHELAKSQMSGFSGMLSFKLKSDYNGVLKFLDRLELFQLAESLGAVESLVNHPAKMTHASVPADLKLKLGISENLLRLSVGVESEASLIKDLDSAFKAL